MGGPFHLMGGNKMTETTVLVKIQKRTLDAIFQGFEKRKATEPNFKYGIPNDDTVIEFRTSSLDGPRSDPNVLKEIPYQGSFGCFDDETNVLVIQ